ncbi:MAG TPA: hypothetical protein VGZ73_26395 [Bryobacteraceae bacterium]|jgi:DUF4097 and DUF4098 domain-containing protein YvlB|nr:hypothetical protein [Bryobacteraceae bacterium]
MLRSALFSALGVLALLPFAGAQRGLTCKNGKCEKVIYGTAPAGSKLRVNAHGPVALVGGTSPNLLYTVTVSVSARSEAEARRWLQQYEVRVVSQGSTTVFTAPSGPVMAAVSLKAPRLRAVEISTSDGAVEASGVDGPLEVDSGAGPLTVDDVRGDCKLATGGGDVHVGQIGGTLRCSTGAGHITVKTVHGAAVLETNGGDIVAGQAGGQVHATTGGGGVHIGTSGGPVTATSGGGEIIVEKANGIVTVRNMAGPVQVWSSAGVRCDSGSGGIHVSNISGPMRVSTSMGSILANLLGSRLSDSYLATGNGDITVLIPSNVGVMVQAQDNLRIVSEFRELSIRRQGPRVIAEGPLNGGGPLLQISGMGGTIFLKRQ